LASDLPAERAGSEHSPPIVVLIANHAVPDAGKKLGGLAGENDAHAFQFAPTQLNRDNLDDVGQMRPDAPVSN
jgi:hypothetical protein